MTRNTKIRFGTHIDSRQFALVSTCLNGFNGDAGGILRIVVFVGRNKESSTCFNSHRTCKVLCRSEGKRSCLACRRTLTALGINSCCTISVCYCSCADRSTDRQIALGNIIGVLVTCNSGCDSDRCNSSMTCSTINSEGDRLRIARPYAIGDSARRGSNSVGILALSKCKVNLCENGVCVCSCHGNGVASVCTYCLTYVIIGRNVCGCGTFVEGDGSIAIAHAIA